MKAIRFEIRKCAIALIVWALMGIAGWGQNEVQFRLQIPEETIAAGGRFEALLTAQIQTGWHLYSMTQPAGGPLPTTIEVDASSIFEAAGPVRQPEPLTWFDPNFGVNTEYFGDRAEFRIPVEVSPAARQGRHALAVRIRFQACSDRLCLPPQTRVVTREVPLSAETGESGSDLTPDVSSAGRPAGGPSAPLALESEAAGAFPTPAPASLPVLAYLLGAMTMGGLALLTPCVFPMIPVTVSYFTKRETSRKQAILEAAIYAVGIVLTFTLIGFTMTFLFGAGGINRLAASPLVNLFISLVFVLFALSLFGVIEIRLPSSWINAIDRKSSTTGGVTGILLMAVTFSLTSFTCTVPFVGTVMVAALQGDLLWAVIGVGAFATVFAFPFFLLALFPAWLQSLPRSGNWMNSLKITMGFLELAAAMKFVSNIDLVYQWEIITRPVFITVWLSIALITTVYLLGKFRFPHETESPPVGALRVLSAIFFLAVALYLFRGLFGFPLGELDAFLPPRDYGSTASVGFLGRQEPEEEWLSDYEEALEVARQENRPIFIDFTGYTCTNCRWMEANVFTLAEVRALFRKFILVRLYTDGTEPEHADNLRFERDRFGTIALPLYAIMSPADEIVDTFPGLTRDKTEFIEFLGGGLAWDRTARQRGTRREGN